MPAPMALQSNGRCKGRRAFVVAAMAVLAIQLLADLQTSDMLDGETLAAFAVPAASPTSAQLAEGHQLDQRSASSGFGTKTFPGSGASSKRGSRTATHAAASMTVVQKVINAMGAGAVASVIQAALSAVGEPIVNRVLVKRMKVMEAVRDVSPMQMLIFFKTTLITNFLKFPFFEAINALCGAFPIPAAVRGIITGLVFTSATLPVTNYRYRKSMDLEVNVANLYEAYFPTVIRDMVYGIARNYFTVWAMMFKPTLTPAAPELLFFVVIAGCLVSAPFNEWRGYLLQTKGSKIPFKEFFKPSNFIRSTSLGALKQGLALAVGYWCAPPATQFVRGLFQSVAR